ncbi:MAG TPA: peptide chain release factor N(5)-glutamine methyltransferase [Candidatus Limnocylindria bacterium]|nr:peptide chain release factor N(5)-glutamine methyltransferase [Candidatus Limnocylindria bacterium]
MIAAVGAGSAGAVLREAALRLRASGSPTALLDAQLLLGHVLGVERAVLLAEPERRPAAAELAEFARLVERRAAGEPVAYLRGRKEFYGLSLTVDRRVLIPRPETELLVDLALSRLASSARRRRRLWDVGTGSGAIAVAVAVEARRRGLADGLRILASDISREALDVALANAQAHGVADTIDFARADLLELEPAEPADLLLANLPYIPTDNLPGLAVAARFEPVAALDGGRDGLQQLRRLMAGLPAAVRSGAGALLEIGADQAAPASSAATQLLAGWQVAIHDDLAGNARVIELIDASRRPARD